MTASPAFHSTAPPGATLPSLSGVFKTLTSKSAQISAGEIDTVVGSSILMKDSTFVEVVTIITATAPGLNVKFGRGINLRAGGEAVTRGKRLIWTMAMPDGVP
ncbi:monooxygenase [Diaporthe helianthi]|uniref:Monooxygenase n=1 Tax=Diaporthe helianthi TaxID=158607 RepID=A0A2P5IB43_DIAHE|nr:monooxygenase [Diaporthe helianthi]